MFASVKEPIRTSSNPTAIISGLRRRQPARPIRWELVMCFGRIPPEVNSGRMYDGVGSSSLAEAAAAWDRLAKNLTTTSAFCRAATLELSKGWQGPVATAVVLTMARYLAWLDTAADQASSAAINARAAVRAHDAVVAALVAPDAIALNRTRSLVLSATNHLGHFSAAIADTDAEYERMWVADANAMYAYARASAEAASLAPVNSPSVTGIPATPSAPSWALSAASDVVSAGKEVTAAIPRALRALSSSPRTTLDVHLLPATSALSVLSSLAPPSAVALRNLNSMNKTTLLLKMAATSTARREVHAPLAKGFGSGTSIGSLTVPLGWVAQVAPSDVAEFPSDWIREPIRLVYASAQHGDGE